VCHQQVPFSERKFHAAVLLLTSSAKAKRALQTAELRTGNCVSFRFSIFLDKLQIRVCRFVTRIENLWGKEKEDRHHQRKPRNSVVLE